MRLGELGEFSKVGFMISAITEVRVRYQETDQMGVVYHGNYFTWFESARIELLDQMECSYQELEKGGYLLPVLTCEARFIKPAKFDDRLQVTALIKTSPVARIEIFYEVKRNEELLAKGATSHAFVNEEGKLIKPPIDFLDKAKKHFLYSPND